MLLFSVIFFPFNSPQITISWVDWFIPKYSYSYFSHSPSRSKYSLFNINLYFCLSCNHICFCGSVSHFSAVLPPLFSIPLLYHHHGDWLFSSFIQSTAICVMWSSNCISAVLGMFSNYALKMQICCLFNAFNNYIICLYEISAMKYLNPNSIWFSFPMINTNIFTSLQPIWANCQFILTLT